MITNLLKADRTGYGGACSSLNREARVTIDASSFENGGSYHTDPSTGLTQVRMTPDIGVIY